MKTIVLLMSLLLTACYLVEGDSYGEGILVPMPHSRLAAGRSHAMIIADDNSLWAWGSNWRGQLGDGTTENRVNPVKVLDDVTMAVAFDNSSMAIRKDKTLWAWGDNTRGLLGDGTISSRNKPVKVMDDVVHVDMARNYTLFVKSDGSLWGWINPNALNDFWPPFFLNDIVVEDRFAPVKLINEGVTFVSASLSHIMVIKEDNTLWGWGLISDGAVGIDPEVLRTHEDGIYEPSFIMNNVTHVLAELEHTSVITEGGELWAWGLDYLMTGTRMQSGIPVKLMDNVAMTPTANQSMMTITPNGDLISWVRMWNMDERDRSEFETGIRLSTLTIENPLLIMENVAEAVTGSRFDFMIIKTNDNEIWAWGNNDFGQLGIPSDLHDTVPLRNPIKVISLNDLTS